MIKAFNVGCMWFADKRDIFSSPRWGRFEVEKYNESISRALSKVPGISNLKVTSGDHYTFFEAYDHEHQSIRFFPIPFSFRCEFTISIAEEVQRSYDILTPTKIGNADINVILSSGSGSPVLYVSYNADTLDSRPSDATYVLRKYLEDQVNKIDAAIELKILGPSPFHADFFMELGQTDRSEFELKDITAYFGGYGSFLITCDKDHFENLDDAYVEYFITSFQIVAHFYDVVKMRNDLSKLYQTVEKNLENLVSIEKARGPRGYIRRLIQAPAISTVLMISVSEVETQKLALKALKERVANKRDSNALRPFATYAENEIDKTDPLPLTNISELAKFFLGTTAGNLQNIVALLAGLMGGAIGAVITLAAKH